MRFLDANVFLRYLTRDDERKAEACRALFRRLQRGEEEATTNEVILHEVLYVLCSPRLYELTHEEAAARLRPILAVRGLRLPHKRRYQRALDLFATFPFLDFGDALAIAQMDDQGMTELYSYDADFDRVEAVKRVEP
ncbi:MAG TPA: type II toxin-antitoxin system VapC family toxin [Dehalococcoidia bacterium]|nr:type II toxin-antitoxin system VapC family toxin [Dehalococcoidia bacterium]